MNVEEILKNNKKYHIDGEMVSIPTVDNAGIIAVDIIETLNPELSAQEQTFFVASFQECVKYLKLQNDAWAASKSADKASRS